MTNNKVSFTARLDPKLLAYIKQQAPDNMSRFVEELVRKHAADNIQDDTFARIKRAIVNDGAFLDAVASRVGVARDTDADSQAKLYDPKRPYWSPFGPLPVEVDGWNKDRACDPNVDPDSWIPFDVVERNARL